LTAMWTAPPAARKTDAWKWIAPRLLTRRGTV
jgi:hypothetical protein